MRFLGGKFGFIVTKCAEIQVEKEILKQKLGKMEFEKEFYKKQLDAYYELLRANLENPQPLTILINQDSNISIGIDFINDLPAIQSNFQNIKDIMIKANPDIERNLNEIGDNLDEVSPTDEKEKLIKPFNKLGRFLKELGDENSDIHKMIKGTKKGIEYAQKLGKIYNKFAQWLMLPQAPDLFLGK